MMCPFLKSILSHSTQNRDKNQVKNKKVFLSFAKDY